ncbi:MAG: endonuclease [Bacilli bacterium]|jgi:endonuclease I
MMQKHSLRLITFLSILSLLASCGDVSSESASINPSDDSTSISTSDISSDPSISEQGRVTTPSNVAISGSILSWDAVEHSTGYEIYVTSVRRATATSLSYDLAQLNIVAPGTYQVAVKALGGDGYLDSEMSGSVQYIVTIQLLAPTIYQFQDTVRWNAVNNASSYQIFVDGDEHVTVNVPSWNVDFSESGTYPIAVKAISSNANYSSSDFSNALQFEYVKEELYSIYVEVDSIISNDWSLPYLYADFEGDFQYYPLQNDAEDRYVLNLDMADGTYHYNSFLGTIINVDTDYPATSNQTGGNEFIVDDETSQEIHVSFLQEPDEPTKYNYDYSSYYSAITSWTDSTDLLGKLNALVNTDVKSPIANTNLDFDSGTDRWNVLANADQNLSSLDFVDLAYVNFNTVKNDTNNSSRGWQREHAFGQALGNFDASNTRGDSNLVKIMRSDWHNLFASDGSANGSRSNMNLGNVDPNAGVISYCSNSKGDRALYSEGKYIEGIQIFEPGDIDKGKLARAIFYMATRYSDLQIVEELVTDMRQGKIGCLNDLLSWADTFDVSRSEYQHNSVVYSYQNNRNPFVDYPELVDFAFGSKKNVSVSNFQYLKPSHETVVGINASAHANYATQTINPTSANIKTQIEYEVGSTFDGSAVQVYDVTRDFSKSLYVGSYTSSPSQGHVFSSSDVGAITSATFTIGDEVITYPLVVVDADPTSSCSYSHVVTGTANGKDFNAYKNSTGPFTADVTLDGIAWKVHLDHGQILSTYANGTAFGKEEAACGMVYFETTGFNNVGTLIDKIYVKADISGTQSPSVKIYLDDSSTAIYSATIIRNGSTAQTYGTNLTGSAIAPHKIKIEFSNLTAALRIYGLYINNQNA